jgi:hypothetical protein
VSFEKGAWYLPFPSFADNPYFQNLEDRPRKNHRNSCLRKCSGRGAD